MLWIKKKSGLTPDLERAQQRVGRLSDGELRRWIENLLVDIGREAGEYFAYPDLPHARDHLGWAKNHVALLQLFLDDAESRAAED